MTNSGDTLTRALSGYFFFISLLTLSVESLAQETASAEEIDHDAVSFFRYQGLENSRVMEYAWWLTDYHGPRLTGGPNLHAASQWAVEQFREMGIERTELEPWGEFGRGWSINRFTIHELSPHASPIVAYPKAWSSGSGGRVEAEVAILDLSDPSELEEYAGQLSDKIVFLESAREIDPWFDPPAQRRDEESLTQMAEAGSANASVNRSPRGNFPSVTQTPFLQARLSFLFEEEPLAIIDRYFKGDGGTVFIQSASLPVPEGADWRTRPRPWDLDAPHIVPQITMATETYNRIYRLVERGIPVTLEIDLDVTYHTDYTVQSNVIAEIPGTDPEIGEEIVMLGAHLDSWHAGTGATDNASGSSVIMETMRLLRAYFDATGTEPRRTIRAALWTGEEQGLMGSREYVHRHFARSPVRGARPDEFLPDYENFSAYFNYDNGTGAIRGIYAQNNRDVVPIFEQWLEPFDDLNAETVTILNTGGTDHLSFDEIGLPGFQFIQDHIAYSSLTHHSSMDVFDHLLEEDLMRSAVIMTSFVFHTAQRDERLPRKVR